MNDLELGRQEDIVTLEGMAKGHQREDIGVRRALGAQVAVLQGKVEEFTEDKEKVEKQLPPEEGAKNSR